MVYMNTTFAERLDKAIEALGLKNKAALAELLGLNPQAINNWVNRGQRVGSSSRKHFQDTTGISVDWLNENDGEMWLPKPNLIKEQNSKPYLRNISSFDNDKELPNTHFMSFPKLEYYLSAGNGGPDPDAVEQSDKGIVFRSDFIAQQGWSQKTHYTMRAKGDSMEPTIQDGAPVVIATNEKKIVSGKIYALLIDNDPYLKRLDKLAGGLIRVRSDNISNLAYSAYEISETQIQIIGRAVWTPVML